MLAKPTIKGIFVNSHIKALQTKKGDEAVILLEKQFGKPINFKNSEDVLVSDEVKIIELTLSIMSDTLIPKEKLAFEAGRLHFQNFVTTPLAKIIFSLFKNSFKLMMLNSEKIAGHVFQGVEFKTADLSENSVKVTMKNNDYPLDHFKGLFYEWMSFSGLTGEVAAKKTGDLYEYTMTWK